MKLSQRLLLETSKLPALQTGERVAGLMVYIYAATHSEDTTEGRGPTVVESYHTTPHAALIACKGIGVMGADGEVEPRLALKLRDDKRYFILDNEGRPAVVSDERQDAQAQADLKDKVLAKLTEPEKAALKG